MGSILRNHSSTPAHGLPLTGQTADYLESFAGLTPADQIHVFGLTALKFLEALDVVLSAMSEAIEAGQR